VGIEQGWGLRSLPPVQLAELADPDAINAPLLTAYQKRASDPAVRRTHHFHGRFENTYLDRETMPEVEPVIDFAHAAASQHLGMDHLHLGFWFNEMHPGHQTSLHDHAELDELLSAVYYVTAPPQSGRLRLRDDPCDILITPQAGLLVLFPPDVPHDVEVNASNQMRLSIAFNFGPPDAAS
jgi:uncharacterized RmlC-like cupin family protein